MSTMRPQTKNDICVVLDRLTRRATGQSLPADQLEQLYNRLRDRGVIKYAPALGVYLAREPSHQDLALAPVTGGP